MAPTTPGPFLLLSPPYRRFQPLDLGSDRGAPAPPDGACLVWMLPPHPSPDRLERVRRRPPGVSLLVVLPPGETVDDEAQDALLRVAERCRPQNVLPHHAEPSVDEVRTLLRRPPDDLAVEVVEYLRWRGIRLDPETRRLARRVIELSGELRTVSGLARGLYLSRRALGRRFLSRGVPVPSHWLHFGRLLRAAIRLQNEDATLFSVACDLGYPDGFALSNQMMRLVGVRPSVLRGRLGWEWVIESWLRTEATSGGLSREHAVRILGGPAAAAGAATADPRRAAGRRIRMVSEAEPE